MSLSPASPRSPLRLARPRVLSGRFAAGHVHWLAGRPRLQGQARFRPLAGSPGALWLQPRTPAEGGQGVKRRGGMGGREDACAVGAAGPGGAERRELGRAARP